MDIIFPRPLHGKDQRTKTSTSSTSSTAPTDTNDQTPKSKPTTSTFSSEQLILSVTSPALAYAIIHSRIKLKKVHTSAIDKGLLKSLGNPAPLAPGLNRFDPKPRIKNIDFLHLFVEEKSMQDRTGAINLVL